MQRYLRILIGAFLLASFLFAGCTKYAKEEQLNRLAEAKAAVFAAEQKLEQNRAELKEWEEKVAKKQKELEAVQKQYQEVEKKYKK